MSLSLDQALTQIDISLCAFRRVETTDQLPQALMPGQTHLVAVLSGEGGIACGAGSMRIQAGQLLLLPAHATLAPVAGAVLAHGLLSATLLDGRSLFEFLALPHRFDAAGSELFTGAIPELLRESAYAGPGSAAIITCLARRVVTALVRDAWRDDRQIVSAGTATRQQRIGKIVDLFQKDPGREYTLDGLAGLAGMSRTVFHREFVAQHGCSPLTMLRTLRLKRSEKLLRQTDMPIKTVSSRMGYRSRSHFCKIFKDEYGVDPEQFRTRHNQAGH